MKKSTFGVFRYVALIMLLQILCLPLLAQQNLALDDYIVLAKQHYPLHANKKLLNEAQKLSLDKLNLQFIPHIRFQGKASYQSDVTTMPFSPTMIQNMGINYTPLKRDQYGISGELTQPIVDMATLSKKHLTKAQYSTHKAQLDSDLHKVSQMVINAYFSLMLLEESKKQNELHTKELLKNAKNLNLLYSQGVIDKDAIYKIEIEILNTKKLEDTLDSQFESALYTLSQLIDKREDEIELDVPDFEVSKNFLESIKIQVKMATDSSSNNTNESSLNTAISDLFVKRPESYYFMVKTQEIATQKKLENAKLMPYVEAFFQGGYANPGLNFLKGGFTPYYIAGVRFGWDISSLWTKKIQNELILNQQLQLQSRQNEFVLNNNILLNDIINKAEGLLLQMHEDEEILALRERILKASEVKLRNGVISINDFITDINNTALARLNRQYTRLEFLAQIYNIKQTLNVW